MKFLIVKTSSLGDIVHTYPVLHYLKNRFPEAHIDWVVEHSFAELVRTHPNINQTLTVSTKTWRRGKDLKSFSEFYKQLRMQQYDAVFDLQGNCKSGLITFFSRSKNKVGFAKSSVAEWPNLLFTNRRFNSVPGRNIREDYLGLVKSYFGDDSITSPAKTILNLTQQQSEALSSILKDPLLDGRKIVMVCPGSAWANKKMTDEALVNLLHNVQRKMEPIFLFTWGSELERETSTRLQQQFPRNSLLLDRLALPLLQRLMNEMDLVIAMDSLPLHLAGTTDAATLSVFGASSALKYQPAAEQNKAFQGVCPYGRTFEKRCPILRTCKTGACIRSLTGNEDELLQRIAPRQGFTTEITENTERGGEKK